MTRRRRSRSARTPCERRRRHGIQTRRRGRPGRPLREEPMKTLDASSYTTALNARREQSLGQMAYDKLLDMLVRRDLPAGTVLHERRLAEMLDISRTPTREAMSRLET